MRRVIIESPYAGDDSKHVEQNLRYLRACMADSLRRGEAPYASHALYTQPGVLRDNVPEERAAGIHAGFAWRDVADATIVYTDLGISKGMRYGIDHAAKNGKPIEYRELEIEGCENGWDTICGEDRDLFCATYNWTGDSPERW